MDRFIVRPGDPLSGEVAIGGAKNSVLKLMAAALLVEGTTVLRGVPRITDVELMAELLRRMGLCAEQEGDVLTIDCPAEVEPEAPWDLVEQMRASIVVLGPLLARLGEARVALPGGDDFGRRPIDMHLSSLERMGATFTAAHGVVEGRCERLVGTRIMLDMPSVGATENVLMAAVLAEGETVVENAACEPELADLAAFLNRMGARILGAGTPTITVQGVTSLQPVEHTVIPDRVEAATFLCALAAAGGEVVLRGARPDHLGMVMQKLGDMGLRTSPHPDGVWAMASGRLRSVDVATLPYPGIATDVLPLLVAVLTVADGVSIATENIFSGRFRYIQELERMGADIRVDDHHAVIRGVARLSGAPVRAPDIRAGAALVVAGLAAEGETVVAGAEHLDRGYEHLAEKLQGLGADVSRG